MKYLLDTRLLLWAANEPSRLFSTARRILTDKGNGLFFSPASFWEIDIKSSLGREDFKVDINLLKRGLLDNGYSELPIQSDHAIAVSLLPAIHKDPFDRMLLAQATREGISLLTTDEVLGAYPGPVKKV